MNSFQNIMERLRPLVGLKGWDFCVLWKLSDDQRYLEWMDCCCGGTHENTQVNGGEELQFPVYSVLVCKDVIFQHPITKSCELLAQLPSSMLLTSGIHAQAFISNQPRWLNFCKSSDSSVVEETVGTRVLIPVPGGLLELFVSKQVPEDQNVIDFVITQCNILMEQEAMINSTNIDANFTVNMNMINEEQSKSFLADYDNGAAPNSSNGLQDQFDTSIFHKNIMMSTNTEMMQMKFMESSSGNKQEQQGNNNNNNNNDKDSIKQENERSDSMSDCSDQIDDETDAKYRKRTRRGPPAKNIDAERRRRKRLNGKLYDLRALVPNISNLSKAAILEDAIEFMMELEKQAKELQDELEEHSDDNQGVKNGINNSIPQEILNQNGGIVNREGSSEVVSCSKLYPKSETSHDKGQQMEVQVEVAQIYGNEFFVKIFCEHKAGGFMRLMEALDSLGLEVTNANITSFRGLVSNVFKVEKKDSEMVQADHVRKSLLELTRDPPRVWPEIARATGKGSAMDYHHSHMQNGHQFE